MPSISSFLIFSPQRGVHLAAQVDEAASGSRASQQLVLAAADQRREPGRHPRRVVDQERVGEDGHRVLGDGQLHAVAVDDRAAARAGRRCPRSAGSRRAPRATRTRPCRARWRGARPTRAGSGRGRRGARSAARPAASAGGPARASGGGSAGGAAWPARASPPAWPWWWPRALRWGRRPPDRRRPGPSSWWRGRVGRRRVRGCRVGRRRDTGSGSGVDRLGRHYGGVRSGDALRRLVRVAPGLGLQVAHVAGRRQHEALCAADSWIRSLEPSRATSSRLRAFSRLSAEIFSALPAMSRFIWSRSTLKNTIPASRTNDQGDPAAPARGGRRARRRCAAVRAREGRVETRTGSATAGLAARARTCGARRTRRAARARRGAAPGRRARRGRPPLQPRAPSGRRHRPRACAPTRSRLDFARGLSAISPAVGTTARPGDQLGLGLAPAHADGEVGRADAARARSARKRFTRRSSSEWKEIAASRPPLAEQLPRQRERRGRASRARRSPRSGSPGTRAWRGCRRRSCAARRPAAPPRSRPPARRWSRSARGRAGARSRARSARSSGSSPSLRNSCARRRSSHSFTISRASSSWPGSMRMSSGAS